MTIGCEQARPSPVCMGLNPCTRTLEDWGSTCSHLYLAESHRCRLSSQDADHNPAVHSVLHLRVKLITYSCARGSVGRLPYRARAPRGACSWLRPTEASRPSNDNRHQVSLGEQTPSLRVLATSHHERPWLLAPLRATRSGGGRRRGASAGFEAAGELWALRARGARITFVRHFSR